MSETQNASKKSKQLTLKRTVTIKVVVTDRFKEYLHFELNQSMSQAKERLRMIDDQLNQIVSLNDAKDDSKRSAATQLDSEKVQLQVSINELEGRRSEIDSLELGSHFTQGTVDGFVNVSVGDNLYEKLGGMEILAKDGVVQKIEPVAAPA